MDGVIVDSERHWPSIEQTFYYNLIPQLTTEDIHGFVGTSVFNLYALFVEKYNLHMSKKEFLRQYEKMAETVYREKASLLPGATSLMDSIKEKKLPVGLGSSSPKSWITMTITRFNLGKIFDVVVSSEDVDGEGKPSPKIYLSVAEKLKVNPVYCVAIEDSKNGVLSAKNAGMFCIGLRNGFNNEQDLSKADVLTSNLFSIHEIIDTL